MRHTFAAALSVFAIVRVAAQVFPDPKPPGQSRVVNVTMVIPEFNHVKNVYAWVYTVEAGLITIGPYCITSSTWVWHDPCTDVPHPRPSSWLRRRQAPWGQWRPVTCLTAIKDGVEKLGPEPTEPVGKSTANPGAPVVAARAVLAGVVAVVAAL